MNNGLSCQKLDLEGLFCHHCDDSLAGHRYVLNENNTYCIKCYESIFANSCAECRQVISIDHKDLSYKEKHWHESCFLCNKCQTSLVDKQFGSKADHVYCGPCYGSTCAACGEVFSADMKTRRYKGRQWHETCFICCTCKSNIGVKSFTVSDSNVYCNDCFESAHAQKCSGCKKMITKEWITYRNQPWHRQCFNCTHCKVSLVSNSFKTREDLPYCEACVEQLFSKTCTACDKAIPGIRGQKFIYFEGRHWHTSCFICSSCSTSLENMGFIEEKENIICKECVMKMMDPYAA